MRLRHTRRLLTALVLVVSLAAVGPAAVAGGTTKVTMNDGFDFHGTTVTAGRGGSVKWLNKASATLHDVKSRLPGYFSSGGIGGMDPGENYTKSFRQAGSFGYLCRLHQDYGMTGTVVVPIKVTRSGSTFTVTAASASMAGTDWRNRIQVKQPGSSSWQNVATTEARSATFSSSKPGTYLFRSQVKNAASGATSGWSPTVSKTR